MASISGLSGSGLDVNAIIEQFVAIERRSIDLTQARATTANLALTSYSAIRAQLTSLRTASWAVARSSDWQSLTATSSNEAAVSVTAGSGSLSGSLSFTVNALAAAGSVRSANILSSLDTVVSADLGIFVAAGAEKLGFSTLASDDALALGSHTVTVTQSSAAATKTGSSALAASTVISAGTPNNTLDVTVNGAAYALTIADGTYDRQQLATAVQAAADAVGAAVTVTVDSANKLQIATKREGSAATVQVTGGNALGSLGLTTDASAITGTDGKVQIGSGPINTLTSIDIGGSATLNASAGAISAVFSGGLRAGSVTGNNVSTGDGKLSTVVANVNGANAGVTASAVQVGDGQYRLQIVSNSSGAGKGPNVAAAEFGAAVGSLVTLTTGTDATVTVGSGPGAYTVASASNSISGLLPGVTATLKQQGVTVTITAARDGEAIADKIEALLDAANAVKGSIDISTAYDEDTGVASPLTGDFTVRRLQEALSTAIISGVPWATPGSPGLAGITTDKDGNYTFDRSKFLAAFQSNPAGLERVFTQGGTAASGYVAFVSAGDRARAGDYEVVLTQYAQQAKNIGLEGAWPKASPPLVKVKVGSTEVSYQVTAGDLQADVVNGLNQQFQNASLDLVASVSGTGIEIRRGQYGSAASFDVAWDGSTWNTYTGVDVVGTIGGVTAQGSGQQLMVAFDHASLGGLALKITATAVGSLGNFSYQPGVGQRLATLVLDSSDSVTGYITSSEQALESRIDYIEDQVESMEVRLELYEARLRRQFAALETMLGSLRSQSNWLANQIASLTSQSSS